MKWNKIYIQDISTVVTKGTTPTTYGKPFTSEGINFIKAEALNGDSSLDKKSFAFIDDETHQFLRRSILHESDVLLTIAGANIGKCGYVEQKFLPANTNQAVGIIRIDPNKAFPKFIYYFFKWNRTFQFIQGLNAQAAQPNINLTTLKNIDISLPTLKTQAKIADILSKYDDLIENNRRRIELLEESARSLYREWFVYLRFPGHEHTPIIDGIPEGWEKGTISDFYKTTSGGTPSRKNPDFFTGDINWVKTQELNNGFIFDTEEKITEEAIKSSSAKLLPENTVLVAMYGATIGETGVLVRPATTNQACCGLITHHPNANYMYLFLFLLENKQGLMNLSQGAAQNNISQAIIKTYPMLFPNQFLIEIFTETIKPIFDQIKNLYLQNIKLSQTRDLLLPRLMNGEIAV